MEPHGTRRTRRITGALVLACTIVGTTLAGAAIPAGAGSDAALYTTDFSDPAATAPDWRFTGGATTESGDGFTLTMTPGAYTVALAGAKSFWSSPKAGKLPNDQIVEATLASTTGDPSLIAGVVCRGNLNDDKGYEFLIGVDGYYTIATLTPTGPKRLANPKGTLRTDTVDPSGPNTVRGECTSVGKKKVRVTLFVNDEKVASAVDRTSASKIGPNAYLITEVEGGKAASATYSSFSITGA